MITPAFELSQDAQFLVLSLRVPYTRTSEFDLYIDGTDFKFYAKPYFLRLTLPGRIVEDGREKATFDIDKGLFTLKVPKETAGEHFEGLQMLTSLLAPKGSRSARPLVEDVSGEACGGPVDDDDDGDNEEDEEDFDWQVEQEVYTESSEVELASLQKYGFGSQRSGVFARLQEELGDVTDVQNPDGTTATERRRARQEAEVADFSPDHYLSDLFEDDVIRGLMKFRPWWTALSSSTEPDGEPAVSFTDDEKEQLRRFSNRSYLLDKAARQHVWLGLVDILLAYAYDVRFTEGEHTVESPWTIRKLSGTLCWLETCSSLQEVLVMFGRRVLCYPLYRHFDLVSKAAGDVVHILQSGNACVLKCLLDVHQVFRQNDPAYIMNDLYITDYCIWIQRVKSSKVRAMARALQKTPLSRKDLALELEDLEAAAAMVVAEEEEEEEESERGASRRVPETQSESSCDSSEGDDDGSSSSSDLSEETDNCEAEGQGTAPHTEGGGGESAETTPLKLLPSPSLSAPPPPPVPHSSPVALVSGDGKADPPSAAPASQLIQELGEQVTRDLLISQHSWSNAGAEPQTQNGRPRATTAAAQTEATLETCGSGSANSFLEFCPRRNPLLIVSQPEHCDEDDEEGFIS